MEENTITRNLKWGSTYIKVKKKATIIIACIFLFGYILETPIIYSADKINWINISSAVLTISAIILILMGRIRQVMASIYILYTLLANLILSFLVYPGPTPVLASDALRTMLMMGMILPLAGFLTGKIHALIIGALGVLYYTLLIYKTGDEYLINNAFMIYLIIICFSAGTFYLMNVLEAATLGMNKLISQLSDKNLELLEKNQLLSDQKMLIEKQKDELKAAVESRDTLFSVLSHDLKNPLFSILNFCELIENKYLKNEYDKIIEYTHVIQISALNLHQLLVNLLEWTRLQTGTIKVFPEWIDVKTQVENTVNVLKSMAANKEISLEFQCLSERNFYTDKNMFDTLVRNFLTNAIKYSPKGGRVKIETSQDESSFQLLLQDHGSGMNNEDIQRVMKPGAKKPAAGTAGEYGTGFGLELCKKFIQMQKGSFNIKSELNKGTLVVVKFPLLLRES